MPLIWAAVLHLLLALITPRFIVDLGLAIAACSVCTECRNRTSPIYKLQRTS